MSSSITLQAPRARANNIPARRTSACEKISTGFFNVAHTALKIWAAFTVITSQGVQSSLC